MKILCVSHYYPPHVGGLEIVAQSQARSLAKCGHEVTVVACASDASQKNGVGSGGVALRYVRAIDWCDKYWGIPFPSLIKLNKLFVTCPSHPFSQAS